MIIVISNKQTGAEKIIENVKFAMPHITRYNSNTITLQYRLKNKGYSLLEYEVYYCKLNDHIEIFED